MKYEDAVKVGKCSTCPTGDLCPAPQCEGYVLVEKKAFPYLFWWIRDEKFIGWLFREAGKMGMEPSAVMKNLIYIYRQIARDTALLN